MQCNRIWIFQISGRIKDTLNGKKVIRMKKNTHKNFVNLHFISNLFVYSLPESMYVQIEKHTRQKYLQLMRQ